MAAMVWLALAIGTEVAATSSLRASAGFTRLWPSLVVVVGYAVSFYAMAQALKLGLGLGTSYAIWSGVGTVLVTALGVALYRDELSVAAVVGIVLVIAGVVLINLGAPHSG